MTKFRIRETGAVVNQSELAALHPLRTIPAVIGAEACEFLGIDPVFESPAPPVGDFQSAVRDGVVQDSGKWFDAWKIEDWTPEQIAEYQASGKFDRWEAIKAKRDARLLLGGFPVGAAWFHSDLISRSQFLSNARRADLVAAAGGDMNATFRNTEGGVIAVKRMDNVYVPVAAVLAHAIMDAAELQESKTYAAGVMHKAAMEASPNPAAYDFSAGWPAIFGE